MVKKTEKKEEPILEAVKEQETVEPVESVQEPKKPKKVLSEKQIEVLRLGREKRLAKIADKKMMTNTVVVKNEEPTKEINAPKPKKMIVKPMTKTNGIKVMKGQTIRFI